MIARNANLLIFIIYTLVYCIQAQDDSCVMPDGHSKSKCVKLHYCDSIQNLLRKYGRNLPPNVEHYIRAHACLQGNYVCCPDNVSTTTTPRRTTTTLPTTTESLFDNEINLEIEELTIIDFNELSKHENFNKINDRACGTSYSQRIVHGEIVDLNEIPWAVLLAYKDEKEIVYWNCGGNLINERFVLTAAHCINQDLYFARVGEHTISSRADCNGFGDCIYAQDIMIEKSIVHYGYIQRKYKNDIALLKLASAAKLNEPNINTICLPVIETADIEKNKQKNFTISGWGYTENGTKSNTLLKSTVQLFDTQVCLDSLESVSRSIPVHNENICAGGYNKLHACRGDSGGGLTAEVTVRNIPKTYLYGLLARGIDCKGTKTYRTEYPDVYINIKKFLVWILDNMS